MSEKDEIAIPQVHKVKIEVDSEREQEFQQKMAQL